eukprot:GEMP01043732.1.p1 GENE.GEMP01043732.1~~GEMP01043732.1.p1  ORF type:complete len:370 (+),score=62.53 GEMP01043732.1:59-1111(+)
MERPTKMMGGNPPKPFRATAVGKGGASRHSAGKGSHKGAQKNGAKGIVKPFQRFAGKSNPAPGRTAKGLTAGASRNPSMVARPNAAKGLSKWSKVKSGKETSKPSFKHFSTGVVKGNTRPTLVPIVSVTGKPPALNPIGSVTGKSRFTPTPLGSKANSQAPKRISHWVPKGSRKGPVLARNRSTAVVGKGSAKGAIARTGGAAGAKTIIGAKKSAVFSATKQSHAGSRVVMKHVSKPNAGKFSRGSMQTKPASSVAHTQSFTHQRKPTPKASWHKIPSSGGKPSVHRPFIRHQPSKLAPAKRTMKHVTGSSTAKHPQKTNSMFSTSDKPTAKSSSAALHLMQTKSGTVAR